MKEDTEFKDLTVPQLKEVAKEFAVDLDGITKKGDIIKALGDDGVTFKMYQLLMEADENGENADLSNADEPVAPAAEVTVEPAENVPSPEAPAEPEQQYVVKMTRPNFSYEVRGYRFTRQHPYALVSEEDADFLVEHGGGFRLASPKEIKEFYGLG